MYQTLIMGFTSKYYTLWIKENSPISTEYAMVDNIYIKNLSMEYDKALDKLKEEANKRGLTSEIDLSLRGNESFKYWEADGKQFDSEYKAKKAIEIAKFKENNPEYIDAINFEYTKPFSKSFARDMINNLKKYIPTQKQIDLAFKLHKEATEPKPKPETKYFSGELGKRYRGVKCKLLNVIRFQGESFSYYDSGIRFISLLRTDSGEDLKIFGNALMFDGNEVENGQTVVIDFTTKKNEDYDGNKATVINRVVVKEIKGE